MEINFLEYNILANYYSFIPLASGFLGGIVNSLLGIGDVSGGSIRNTMLDNPMLDKMEGIADNYMDWGSDFYQKGKNYFQNLFTQQGLDQAWSTTRKNDQMLASQGIDPSGGIGNQNRLQTFSNFGNKAFETTKSSLMDMWGAGQNLANQYYGNISDIFNSANAASASQTSQNNASSSNAMGQILSIGAGLIFCDKRVKRDIKHIPNARLFGYPVYEFRYKEGFLSSISPNAYKQLGLSKEAENFKYSGLMAQDVLLKNPKAVRRNPNGYLVVDIDKLHHDYTKGAV